MSKLLTDVVVVGLATWRLASLLVYEEGPFNIFGRFRDLTNSMGGLLDCLWCTSVWIAAFLLAVYGLPYGWILSAWLAISTVSVLLDSVIPVAGE